ncbi:MAG: hypothetical protein MJ166_02960 [Clostridia bacterium]|nr:hypothetical protein [Clostridia bacterium]
MDNNDPRYAQQPAQHPGERYDAIRHIDALICTLRDANGVPFSDKCAVDREEMIISLEELKNRLPMAVAQSNDIVKRAQEIIGTAREKSKKVLNDADRMYAMRVNEHEISRGAQIKAAEIIAEANRQSEELRKSAHLYAKQLLEGCNAVLAENITKVQNTLSEIDSKISNQ